ncbi:MAG: zinc-binding dehydrogenase [Novosphingobium sp.]|nr:zinc-binding dehydrogenase [Novosphingobium sp.]
MAETRTRSGRRIAFHSADAPLEFRDVEVPAPEPGGVLLRVVIAGVCGTDAHRLNGDIPAPPAPVAFGHEGIGRIEALGEGVSTDTSGEPVSVGDLVYFSPSKEDGFPVAGTATPGDDDAPWPVPADQPSVATYQDWAYLAKGVGFFRIPEGTSPEAVIAFGCAMPTAIGGMTRLGGVKQGQVVVVQGCGPVGLSATLLAALDGPGQLIVMGAPDDRLHVAERLGATTILSIESTTREERAAKIAELTGGRMADVVIEATGKIEAFDEGMSLLGVEGRYLVLGIYSGPPLAELNVVRMVNFSQQIIGNLGPARIEDLKTVVELARDHGERLGFADLITHRFPLARAEEAIKAVGSGAAIKAVVLPETG